MSKKQEMNTIEVIRPLVTPKQAMEFCQQLYSLQAITCNELVSYADRNFLVTGTFSGRLVESAGRQGEFVLKVTNSEESEGDIVVQQSRLMQSAWEAGFKVQSVIKTVDGEIVAKRLLSTPADTTGRLVERRHAVRLLSYLPGAPMGEFPMTPGMLESVAMEIGRVNRHLTKLFLHDKAANAIPLDKWSLLSLPRLIDYVQYVQGEARQRLVREVVERFCSDVLQNGEAKSIFTRAFIHGDPNEDNILVTGDPPRLSGLLDWQDSHSACAIFDLAILIMHAGDVHARANPSAEPCSMVAPALIRGYTQEFPLGTAELHQLPLLVAARFALCFTLSAHSYARDPGNAYLAIGDCSWSALDRLWNGHKHRLDQLADEWLVEAARG